MEKLTPEHVELTHIDALCLSEVLRAVSEHKSTDYYKDEADRLTRTINKQLFNNVVELDSSI